MNLQVYAAGYCEGVGAGGHCHGGRDISNKSEANRIERRRHFRACACGRCCCIDTIEPP